jgi:spermidine synthase
LTAGITGAAVMIVEILGAKMLAPYFGTSHFVWTAQIAVTLVALAAGYYAGGRLVGGTARLGRLYGAIAIAAAWLALTVALRAWAAGQLLQLPLAAGSLLCSAFLFFVPLGLLAMTGPFLVRVLTGAVSEVGGTVGRMTAISTLGSFFGTLAIGYILIPLLPNSVTMYGTAALLALVCLCWFLLWRRKASALAAVSTVLAVGLAIGAVGIGQSPLRTGTLAEIYSGNSNFGQLQVLQQRGQPYRYFLTDYLVQNTYDTTAGRSISMFTYMLQGLARAYAPRLERVLCIGMGVGIVPRELARQGVRVDVVEINPAVVPVARRYFDLDPRAFTLFIADGRQYLNACRERYDAVILDAFSGDTTPSHLMTREAFQSIRAVLKPEGVLVMNSFSELDPSNDFQAASLSKTLLSVFPSIRVHASRGGNTMFVASPRAALDILHPPAYGDVHADAIEEVRDAFGRLWEADAGHGIVLTDDFNPVDYYDARNMENHRRSLALSMNGR